jgi:D-3-phosphoglycerate dehydrogenase
MALVAVTDHPFRDLAVAREILEAAGHTVSEHQCRTAEEVTRACSDAEGLLNTYTPLPAATLRALDRCRAIARFGIGVDTVDLDVASERGIAVTNVPDYCTGEVATHAVALLLAVHRRIAQLDRDVRRGGWDVHAAGEIRRLEGSRLGLVGAGRIPRAIAERVHGFGLTVGAFDPYVPVDAWPASIERQESLDEVARESDFLSLHAPAGPETRHMVGERLLSLMPSHAILINTARGTLVDSAALARALREGWIAGAGLDVLENEPLDREHELRAFDTVVFTPHVAFYSEASLRDLQRKAAEELRAALAGEGPRYLVNNPAGSLRS